LGFSQTIQPMHQQLDSFNYLAEVDKWVIFEKAINVKVLPIQAQKLFALKKKGTF